MTAAGDPWIWTSGPVAGDGSLVLVAVVVNPSDRPFHYGVAGTFDRADGDGWVRAGGFASSLDFWGGFGRLVAPGENMFVPAIGLGAPAGGIGQAEYIRLGELPAGRFRLSHRESPSQGDSPQRSASGTFAITETGDELIAIGAARPRRDGGPVGVLLIRPPLVPPAGATVSIQVNLLGSSTPEALQALKGDLADDLVGRAWTGQGWGEPLFAVPTVVRPVPGFDTTETLAHLPPLDEGPYQLAYPHPRGDLTRVIWVTHDVPAG